VSINPDNIQQLLMMADEYHVDRILLWFEHEATISRANSLNPETQEPFTTSCPSLALELAIQFNFKDIGRVALNELAGKRLELVLGNDRIFNPFIIRKIYQMQRERSVRYSRWIALLVTNCRMQCANCTMNSASWCVKLTLEMQRGPSWKRFDKWCRKWIPEDCHTQNCIGISSPLNDERYAGWIEEAKRAESVLPEWPFPNPGGPVGAP
jgi:hypothetical protein